MTLSESRYGASIYVMWFSAWLQCGVDAMKEFSVKSFNGGKVVTCIVVGDASQIPDSICWKSHGLGHPSKIRVSTERSIDTRPADAVSNAANSNPSSRHTTPPSQGSELGPLRRNARAENHASSVYQPQIETIASGLNVQAATSSNAPEPTEASTEERICTVKVDVYFNVPMKGPDTCSGSLPLDNDAMKKCGGRMLSERIEELSTSSKSAIPKVTSLLSAPPSSSCTTQPTPYMTFVFKIFPTSLPRMPPAPLPQPLTQTLKRTRSTTTQINLNTHGGTYSSSSDSASECEDRDQQPGSSKRRRIHGRSQGRENLVDKRRRSNELEQVVEVDMDSDAEVSSTACSPVFADAPVTPPANQCVTRAPAERPLRRQEGRGSSIFGRARAMINSMSSLRSTALVSQPPPVSQIRTNMQARTNSSRTLPLLQTEVESHQKTPSPLLSPWQDTRASEKAVAPTFRHEVDDVVESRKRERSMSPWALIQSPSDESGSEDEDAVLLQLEQRLVETHQIILRLRRRHMRRKHAMGAGPLMMI